MFSVSLSPQASIHNDNFTCTLKWRQNQLRVFAPQAEAQTYSFSLNQFSDLVDCLKHSSVKLVCLDPALGETQIELWAKACTAAGLPVYLKLESQIRKSINWLNTWIDSIESLVLESLSQPLFNSLGLNAMISVSKSWYVGNHGKLYQATKLDSLKLNRRQLLQKLS